MPDALAIRALGGPKVLIAPSPPQELLRSSFRRVVRPWRNAVMKAAPGTPSYSRMWSAESCFLRTDEERERKTIHLGLLWFNIVRGSAVLEWARQNNATLAGAHDMLLFASRYPLLQRRLGMTEGIGVVSLPTEHKEAEGCSCCVWWSAKLGKLPAASLRTFKTEWYNLTAFLFEFKE
jgi:hypothetical protein